VSPGKDLTNILEQGIEIGRQRIAGLVQVPHHLVQIISKPYKLSVDEPFGVAARLAPGADFDILIEQKCATEMHRPHSDSFGSRLDVGKLTYCEADIELLAA